MLGPLKNADQVEPAQTHPPDSDCETDLVPKVDDVRMSKVFAARRAVRSNKYDSEAVLDEVVRRLTDALGSAHLRSHATRPLRADCIS